MFSSTSSAIASARLRSDGEGGRGCSPPSPSDLALGVSAALEPVALRVLPFSAGQLGSFANEGVARTPWPDDLPKPGRSIDAMLRESVA